MSISKTIQEIEKERIFRIKLLPILLLPLAVLLLSTSAFAAPNSMTLQGKLTNLAGASQQGTFNFTFRIYDAASNGNALWELANYNITTDANGVYDVILGGINLSFADQYYLGITVSSDNESVPRINLTSAPYSFRANTSEALNPNASYFTTNLSVAGNATFGNGATKIDISTQGFNFSSATGNMNVNGTINAKSFVGDGSGLTGLSGIFNSSGANVYLNDTTANFGLGLNNPSDRLVVIGNVRISGSLNASSINVTGITLLGTNSGKVGINITNPVQTLQVLGTLNVTAQNTRNGDLFVASTGFVGIGTPTPNDNLDVTGSARISGSLNASSINATNIIALNYYIGWTNLSDYPSACPAGQFISQVGDTLTCAAPSLSAAGGWNDDGATVRLTTFTDSVLIGTNVSGEKLIVNGSFRIDNSTTPVFFVNASAQKVGIGTTSPNDAFEVIGNVRVSGSLNASSINATRIMQGLNLVQTVEAVFNLANLTNFFGDASFNSSVLRVGNMSNIREGAYNLANFTSNYDARTDRFGIANGTALPFSNFQLSNVSNVTSWSNIINVPAFSNFQLSNVSNNTLVKGDNASISLWNRTATAVFLRDAELAVKIGNISDNLLNNFVNDTFAVFGSASVYGSLNATFINATSIIQNGNLVQTVNAVFNKANASQLPFSNFNLENVSNTTSWSNIINIPALSNFQLSNVSNTTSWSNIINIPAFSNFQLSNVSNDTLRISGNSSIALWNRTSTAIYLRNAELVVKIGNISDNLLNNYVNDTLAVFGSAAVYGSLNATYFNATSILQSGNKVQTVESAFNLANYSTEYASTGFKISNGTALPFSNFQLSNVSNVTSWSNIINIPAFSNFQLSNVSNTTSWSNIINIPAFSNFQLSNVSNDTLRISGNSSIALWNVSGSNIFNREFGGNVGIGTASPSSKLEVAGTANITQGTTSFRVTSDNNVVFHLE